MGRKNQKKKVSVNKSRPVEIPETEIVSAQISNIHIDYDDSIAIPVNTRLYCLFKNAVTGEQEYKSSTVLEVERRDSDTSLSSPFVYYIHYNNFDRRMDIWVDRSRLATLLDIRHWKALDVEYEDYDEEENDPDADASSFTDLGFIGEDERIRAAHRLDSDDEDGGHGADGHGDLDAEGLAAHHEATKVKNVGGIRIGQYEIEAWYFSPYPVPHKTPMLYICEFCLDFFVHESELCRHSQRCSLRHPPGNEIYRSIEKHVTLVVFEIDGAKEVKYCQNLCYMAKLFLDHKLLYWDTLPFLFYILTEADENGCHMVGYFSKEKHSDQNNNLACILTVPSHQRKGYGRILIQFSYALSKVEAKAGTPERPLSDLGRVSYLKYWNDVIIQLIRDRKDSISIKEISRITCITTDDIIDALTDSGLLRSYNGDLVIDASSATIRKFDEARKLRESRVDPKGIYSTIIHSDKLHFVPYSPSRKRKIINNSKF